MKVLPDTFLSLSLSSPYLISLSPLAPVTLYISLLLSSLALTLFFFHTHVIFFNMITATGGIWLWHPDESPTLTPRSAQQRHRSCGSGSPSEELEGQFQTHVAW